MLTNVIIKILPKWCKQKCPKWGQQKHPKWCPIKPNKTVLTKVRLMEQAKAPKMVQIKAQQKEVPTKACQKHLRNSIAIHSRSAW
jgi:hypothetical protein